MVINEMVEKQAVSRMKMDNPWWSGGAIREDFMALTPRAYLENFHSMVGNMKVRRAFILVGPRRVGKTVMIYHTIQRLINEGFSPQNLVYLSVETPIYNGIPLEQLMLTASKAVGKDFSLEEQYYVFFDEVQYLKDWEIHLKSLVDAYPNVRFVASGSAAAALKKSSIESGAGRFTDFHLPPLLFYEYLRLQKQEHLIKESEIVWNGKPTFMAESTDIQRLNQLFVDYINYGGYPEVAFSTEIQSDPGQYIRHDIVDKVLMRDLPVLYGISDVQELNSIFTMIAYLSGNQFSYESLAQNTGVKKDTLRKYMEYLEAAFLIKTVHRTDQTAKRYQRERTFKIYLTNPSLRCALFQPITMADNEIGEMVETAVFAQWIPRMDADISYASWRIGKKEMGEVDIVGINAAKQKPDWAVEVKWSDCYFENPNELMSLKTYMETNDLRKAVVTTMTRSGLSGQPWGDLHFMPAACYAYIVGRNTLMRTKTVDGF